TPPACTTSTRTSRPTATGLPASTALNNDAHPAFIRTPVPGLRRRRQRTAPAHVSFGFRFLDSRSPNERANRARPRSLLSAAERRRDSLAFRRNARLRTGLGRRHTAHPLRP